jgi:uncharacterized membrane protein YhaH (DUF805 family)
MKWMLLPLKRYAEFSGRSRRKEYWMFYLGVVLLYALLIVLLFAAGASGLSAATAEGITGLEGTAMVILAVMTLVWLALLIPGIAVGVRRLHDIDRTGWWLMAGYGPYLLGMAGLIGGMPMAGSVLTLVSYAGFILLFIFSLLDGTKGANRFGEDPKQVSHESVFA